MSDTWTKIKIWTKLSLIGLVALFLLLFIYFNYSYTVTFWLFGKHEMSVLELLVATFLFGVIVTLLARPTYRTLGQISQLRSKKVEMPAPPAHPAPPAPPPSPSEIPTTPVEQP